MHCVRQSLLAKASRGTGAFVIRYLVCPSCEYGAPPPLAHNRVQTDAGVSHLRGPAEQAAQGGVSSLGLRSPDPRMLCT